MSLFLSRGRQHLYDIAQPGHSRSFLIISHHQLGGIMEFTTVIIVGLAISVIQDQETNVSIAVLRVFSKS